MSVKIVDGGPAFPSEQGTDENGCWNQTHDPGMSLRDWFAGQALAGILASGEPPRVGGEKIKGQAAFADLSYSLADAMLAARNNGGGDGEG